MSSPLARKINRQQTSEDFIKEFQSVVVSGSLDLFDRMINRITALEQENKALASQIK